MHIKVMQQLRYATRWISTARLIDDEAKRLASEGSEVITDEDRDFIASIISSGSNLAFLLHRMGLTDWSEFTVSIYKPLFSGLFDYIKKCRGLQRKYCVVPDEIAEMMKDVDENYRKVSGRERCTHNYNPAHPYTFSSMLDDIASCLHEAIEKAEQSRRG